MKTRPLGNSGLDVTAVSLGSWLTYGGTVGNRTAVECIARAHDRGITFFDTANVYSGGGAEEVLGEALADYNRDSLVVATKVYFPVGPSPEDQGLSRRHILDQIDKSLRRLRMDHIELYQCHRYDDDTPLEETAQVMNELVLAGKIRYWGVSEWTAMQIENAVSLCRENGWAPPVSNQPQYSALYRRIEREVIPVSEQLGLSQVVWSPLAQGVLTGKYTSVSDAPEGSRAASRDAGWMRQWLRQPVLDAVQKLKPIAQERGVTIAQLALAWCLRLDNIAAVIVGASRPEQVDDNVAAADIDLDEATITRIDDALAPVTSFD
ncbi:MAG: aldo/keto reductase family protein [Candidatus Dormibacteria bacterium]